MKFLPTLFVIATFSINPAQAFNLVCTIKPTTDNSRSGVQRSLPDHIVESWLAPKQAFVIDLKKKEVTDLNFKRKIKLEIMNSKRLQWRITGKGTDSSKRNYENLTYKYRYIRKSKKLFVNVDFGGSYIGIKSTKPKCVES